MSEQHSTYTFLLGSGVSCAAKLPNLQKLSCAVSTSVSGDEGRLLQAIKRLSGATHGEGTDSYEDWAFVATQIFEHECGDFENPALLGLMERLCCSLNMENHEIMSAAERLVATIAKRICHELSAADARPGDGFARMTDAIEQRPSARLRFFSLNHDLLLEKWLRKFVPYTGLKSHPDSSIYKRLRFCMDDFHAAPVSVIKLHGSLNWRGFRPHRSRQISGGEFIGIATCLDDNRRFELIDDVPRLLMGTFNKIFRYATPVFLPLFAAFQQTLRDSNCLTVCGYGFGDKGINSFLIDWMCSQKDARMIVIDPDPFDENRCRPAIARSVELWKKEGKLEIKARSVGAKDMTWTEILDNVDAR